MANAEISILALSLAPGLSPQTCKEYIKTAADFGVNLFDAGADLGLAKLARVTASESGAGCGILASYGGASADGLAAWLEEGGFDGRDAVALRAGSAEELERLHRAGAFASGVRARRSGKTGSFGASMPADPALIRKACEMLTDIDFIRIPLNLLLLEQTPGLREAIRFAGECELSFIASDPFAGGKLVPAPAAAHQAYANAPVPRSHEEWALRAVWELQETATISLEPADAAQLERACVFAEAGRANSLPMRELAVLKNAADAFQESAAASASGQKIY